MDQAPGVGQRRASEGHAAPSPSCRAPAGRGGGPIRGWRARSRLTSPFRAAGLVPASHLPSTPQFHFAKSRLQEQCQRRPGRTHAAAGNTAAARSWAAGASAASRPHSRGPALAGGGGGLRAAWTPASPAPSPVAAQRTCTRGWRYPGARFPPPQLWANAGKTPGRATFPQSPGQEGTQGRRGAPGAATWLLQALRMARALEMGVVGGASVDFTFLTRA